MHVSVVIPAHNAAETLAETLESLLAQTHPGWEAIVVDDGSRDKTAAIAARYARRDRRIRTARQRQRGVSAARNKGIRLARHDWLLFLDADDWLSPLHLERMTEALARDPSLDAVHCGWVRVAPDGKIGVEHYCMRSAGLFDEFARRCLFAIHACVARRSLVEAVGGFDPVFNVCQDWDLWQRIARTDARFGAVREVLAYYRIRPGSASSDGRRLLDKGLRVIAQGHSADPRVSNPHPAHAHGRPVEQLPGARFVFVCYAAGLEIGAGRDVLPLLGHVREDRDHALDPHQVANMLFYAVPVPSGRLLADWSELWPSVEGNIDGFLAALEEQSTAFGLARRTRFVLERLILDHVMAPRPWIVGTTCAIRIEVTDPIADISPPAPCERLRCEVTIEGTELGTVELPVCDGLVPSHVLADSIADRFAWPILGRFLERTVYQDLRIEREADGLSIYRGTLRLAGGLTQAPDAIRSQLHDQVGWTVFLQELWGHPDWSGGRFYDPSAHLTPETGDETPSRPCVRAGTDGPWLVEVSAELTDLQVATPELEVLLTVGGVALGAVTLPVRHKRVHAQELRAALTNASGFELCRAAVREGLLGQSLEQAILLRERLAAAASEAAQGPAWLGAPGSVRALGQARAVPEQTVVLGRRAPDTFGTSASRRAMLPAAAARELVQAAAVAGEPILHVPQPGLEPRRVIYAPDLIRCSGRRPLAPTVLHESADTYELPILIYHHIAPDDSPAVSPYQMTPELFEGQLRYLHNSGFRSACLEEWRAAKEARRPLSGRAVLITFDHGYRDFAIHAWPLLRRYGFSAVVFLVVDEVATPHHWDYECGYEVPMLDWQEIRYLQDEGVEFGSHTASHCPLTGLSPACIVREGARSRAILERVLGVPIRALAYPYGDVDPVVQHLVGACGYTFGLSCHSRLSRFHDDLLALPRIEVTGLDSLADLVTKLGS